MINYSPVKVIFSIDGIKIYSWGSLVFLAFLLVAMLIHKKAKNERLNSEQAEILNEIINFMLIIFVSGFIGARLFYAFENGFSDFLKIWQGGLSWYGGLLFSFLAIFIYTKAKKLPFRYIELIAIFLPLGFALARIGCFLNWDDYGKPTNLPWGIKVEGDVARHPSQIYEAIASVIIFSVLFIIDKKQAKQMKQKVKRKLFMTELYFFLYAFIRFWLDFVRDAKTYFGLTFAQYISLAILIFLGFYEIKRFIKKV